METRETSSFLVLNSTNQWGADVRAAFSLKVVSVILSKNVTFTKKKK